MSYKELDRLTVIRQVLERKITQKDASKLLRLSSRQLRRLTRRYQEQGAMGVVSRHRNRPSSNRISEEIKEQALSHIRCNFYDYGPTLASEKLEEYHGIAISKETARRWMISAGIWHPHQKKVPKVHPSRERRPCFGELVQIDGSIHDWFEERGPRCTLLVFIDDATSSIQKMYFCDQETTINYFTILKDYVLFHGVPRALYFDKHGVFKVNLPEAKKGEGITQFGRVLKTLNIEPIFAHSPQAKGRVERSNGILQDRLVKALRYHGISDIASGNVFLEQFRQDYNRKFAKPPKEATNAHRALSEEEKKELEKLFSIQTQRVISKDMLVRQNSTIYKINEPEQIHRLYRAPVVVCENIEGNISIYHQDKPLTFEVYRKMLHVDQVLNRAGVNSYLERGLKLEKYWLPTATASHSA